MKYIEKKFVRSSIITEKINFEKNGKNLLIALDIIICLDSFKDHSKNSQKPSQIKTIFMNSYTSNSGNMFVCYLKNRLFWGGGALN